MWVVLLILILIVLSVMFGGFQKGTKTGSLSHSPTVTFTVTPAPLQLPLLLLPHRWLPLTGDYAGGSLLLLVRAVALLNDGDLSEGLPGSGVLALAHGAAAAFAISAGAHGVGVRLRLLLSCRV
jgi:hypothetical protein